MPNRSSIVNHFLVEIIRGSADFPVVESQPPLADPSGSANQELARRIQLIYKYQGGLAEFFNRASKEQSDYEEILSGAAEKRINRILEEAACAQYQRAGSES